jgi:uncharacterized membrane protein YqjE
MIHPLLRLLATQPHLVADHAHAYGSLLGEEIGKTTAAWKTRAILLGIAAFLIAIAAVLGGVALMLWAVIEPSSIQAPWALVAAPALPALVAAVCWAVARRSPEDPFKELKLQLAADMALLREVSAS